MAENNGGEQVCSLYQNAKHYFKILKNLQNKEAIGKGCFSFGILK